MKRVFLSSTARDLSKFREAVYQGLEGMDGIHCVRMEDFGARHADAQTFCPEKIAECDLVICLVGLCYGSAPPDSDRSYTELEYDHAVKEGIACLVFLSADDHFYPGYYREADGEWRKQDKFRTRLKDATIADFFKEPDELAGKVLKAVGNWVRETETREDKSPPQSDRMPSDKDLGRANERYLNHLIDLYQYMDFRGMGISDRLPLRLHLLDMYIPLKARIEMPEGETWARDLRLAGRNLSKDEISAMGQRVSEPLPLLDLLQKNDGLIVLGDPGAGKSTFLKFVVLQMAAGRSDYLGLNQDLPVLLPLSAYASAIAETDIALNRFISQYFQGRGIDVSINQILDAALAQGRVLFLLDGIDEVKQIGQRRVVVDRVVDFYTMHRRTGNKFVLTSRIVGYREVRRVVEGVAECTLVDFADENIESFIENWTATIEKAAQGDTAVTELEAQREKKELLLAVAHNPGVRRLAANPLLLTILALMKRQGITLPERRVELYQKYVETLLKHWNLARGLDRCDDRELDVVNTLKILAPLALKMHRISPGVGLMKQEDLKREVQTTYQNRGHADPEAATIRFLEDVRDFAGLLLERGHREYGFIHLTFQEFLAAVGISQMGQENVDPIVKILSDHIDDDNWHEVIQLAIGYIGIIQQRDEAAGAVLQKLLDEAPGKPAQATVLAGEALIDMGAAGVTPQSHRAVIRALSDSMLDESRIRPVRRAAAGRILGKIGEDWRPGVGLKNGLPDIEWMPVKAEIFIMGSKKETDPDALDTEMPQYNCSLLESPFQISRYPVTVAQYQAFVEAAGYNHEQFWTDAGWKWREAEKITGPELYSDIFQTPNHPQVGVSWYEAVAFCNWLSDKTDDPISLPTEAQWEKAARITDGRLPLGQ